MGPPFHVMSNQYRSDEMSNATFIGVDVSNFRRIYAAARLTSWGCTSGPAADHSGKHLASRLNEGSKFRVRCCVQLFLPGVGNGPAYRLRRRGGRVGTRWG